MLDNMMLDNMMLGNIIRVIQQRAVVRGQRSRSLSNYNHHNIIAREREGGDGEERSVPTVWTVGGFSGWQGEGGERGRVSPPNEEQRMPTDPHQTQLTGDCDHLLITSLR